MSISRYRNVGLIDDSYQETKPTLQREDLDKIPVFQIRTSEEDRLDTLAAKYLGDGGYWWVICEINDLEHMFDFTPGKIIKIPINIEDVLRLV